MKLPENAIGITDILKWLECGRRWAYGMRRWTEGSDPPEDVHPDTMYGTIFHESVAAIEEDDLSDEEALKLAFGKFAAFLGPDDMEKLKADLGKYRERDDALGVRCVANEKEIRVPLLEHEGETIYFRAKIDRLYQRLDNEAVFIHRDYKSSKWRKSEEEVHKDLQMWGYNWSIHEVWPECESLTQIYDQLRYGEVPTRKSSEQRERMREWLVRQVTAILEAEEAEPRFNEWCPYCPIKESCPVIDRLTEFETARINSLLEEMPEPGETPEMESFPTYVEKLPEVQTAIKTLQGYEERVKAALKELPADRREALGYKLGGKSNTGFSTAALETAHEILGDDFYRLARLGQRNLKDFLKDDPRLEDVLALAHKEAANPVLRRSG